MGTRVGLQVALVTTAATLLLPPSSVFDGLLVAALPAHAQAAGTSVRSQGGMQLKVRRLSNAVELVIEGVGSTPQLAQAISNGGWQGQLTTASPKALRLGPQRLSMPEFGMQTVTLSGSGSNFQIDVIPISGFTLNRPVVSADGQSIILTFAAPAEAAIQTGRPSFNRPGAVPQSSYAPPLQQRASAPPVGDMAVGTMMLRNQSYINLRGPKITMTLRNASAKDVLMALAQMGGYGIVFVDEEDREITKATSELQTGTAVSRDQTQVVRSTGEAKKSPPVSAYFVGEDFSRAFNSVLLSSGLSARVDGRIIFAGVNVHGKTFGIRLSRIYRLNQVAPAAAADYLANLGASVTKTNTIATSVSTGATQANAVEGSPASSTTTSSSETKVESYGASSGPLLGLRATTDSRLGTITLIGDSALVAIAEQYLRQLDLRQRQVALSIKILDVTLGNDTNTANSFAFRYGNNFIVNDNGALAAAFGGFVPPLASDLDKRAIPDDLSVQVDANRITSTAPPGVEARVQAGEILPDGRINDNQVGIMRNGVRPNPGLQYPANQLYDFVRATIQSQSTKILASPTLILSENPEAIAGGSANSSVSPANFGSNTSIGRAMANESFVTVGENVVTSYQVTAGQNGGPPACQPGFSIAGLTFGARVNKIDDNGFVTFSLSPAISASTKTQEIRNCGNIDILAVRRLDTGTLRVRDGQTLILTGVIQDSDIQDVNKWPVLGDIPLIGQFFRRSAGGRDKRELVIMVTPKIINDESGGVYGYGYSPSTREAREATTQLMN